MYEELVKRLREESEIERWLQPHSANETPKLLDDADDAIEELSKERKTGEWCADYDGYSDGEPVYDMWWCSACGEYFDEWDDKPTWNFCPCCGADMRLRSVKET